MNHICYVDENGKHQVAETEDGIRKTPVGPPFDKPRDAVRYAERLNRRDGRP